MVLTALFLARLTARGPRLIRFHFFDVQIHADFVRDLH